jgi:hypothetical protein
MPNQLIFGADDEGCRKDIIFFTSPSGMVLPRGHITVDSSLMPACAYLLAIRN